MSSSTKCVKRATSSWTRLVAKTRRAKKRKNRKQSPKKSSIGSRMRISPRSSTGLAAFSTLLSYVVCRDIASIMKVFCDGAQSLTVDRRFDLSELSVCAESLADGNLLHLAAMLPLRYWGTCTTSSQPPASPLQVFLCLEACGVPHVKGGPNDDFPFECSMQVR